MKIAPVSPRLHLLQISDDVALARSRSLLLERAGFVADVCSAREGSAAKMSHYELLLFCQSVQLSRAEELAEALCREGAGKLTIRIGWPSEQKSVVFDESLTAPVFPGALLGCVYSVAEKLPWGTPPGCTPWSNVHAEREMVESVVELRSIAAVAKVAG